jgi:TP901 family phage tail tape measure protein
LRRTSATLNLTGTSLEENIGMLTAGFGTLRDIEGVSSGLIMISQRLRGMSEDGDEIEGLASKIEESFQRIAGIDITTDDGGLRSTFDIMSDMARVFPTLTEQQRQYLSELAAGNRQVRVLNSILEGWQDCELAIESANNSIGSANREQEKYLNSIEGRTNRLKSSFQEFSMSALDANIIKGIVSGLDNIVTALTKVNNATGGLLTFGATFAALAITIKKAGVSAKIEEIWSGLAKPKIQGFMECWSIHHRGTAFIVAC